MAYYTRYETATSYLYMMDTDWTIYIQYIFHSYATSATYWQPAEGPGFSVNRIWLARDFRTYEGPMWELTGAMYDLIVDMDMIDDAIIDDINSMGNDEW